MKRTKYILILCLSIIFVINIILSILLINTSKKNKEINILYKKTTEKLIECKNSSNPVKYK